MNDTTAEKDTHPVLDFGEWLKPSTLLQLLTLLVCVVLAWGTVNSRLAYAEQKISEHDVKIKEVEKLAETSRLETERSQTNLERRLGEIGIIKAQIVELDRKLDRLLAARDVK